MFDKLEAWLKHGNGKVPAEVRVLAMGAAAGAGAGATSFCELVGASDCDGRPAPRCSTIVPAATESEAELRICYFCANRGQGALLDASHRDRTTECGDGCATRKSRCKTAAVAQVAVREKRFVVERA
jgi:hypothetical protein